MHTEKLQHAIGAIHVRFGDHALVQANRLAPTRPWPTGQLEMDRVCGIGGLPLGRISVVQGPPGSGKLSLALALLAQATREFARVVVIDLERGFDPWTLERFGGDLRALTLIRPPTAAAAGEAAVALAKAGAGWLLMLGPVPEVALASLESAAARSGCLVIAVSGPVESAGPPGARRALSFASSLTLELQRLRWLEERHQVVGLRSRMSCVKNKLAGPGHDAEVEVRYPLGSGLVTGEVRVASGPGVTQTAPVDEPDADTMVELWDRSAVV